MASHLFKQGGPLASLLIGHIICVNVHKPSDIVILNSK